MIGQRSVRPVVDSPTSPRRLRSYQLDYLRWSEQGDEINIIIAYISAQTIDRPNHLALGLAARGEIEVWRSIFDRQQVYVYMYEIYI